jgi:hypothetical protein
MRRRKTSKCQSVTTKNISAFAFGIMEKGFSPTCSAETAVRPLRVAGMKERAKLIGGKLTIWTELDGGNRNRAEYSRAESVRQINTMFLVRWKAFGDKYEREGNHRA